MEFDYKCFFVGAKSRNYTNKTTGQPSVFYEATLLNGTDVYKPRVSAEVYEQVKDFSQEEVVCSLKLEDYKGILNMRLMSVSKV